MAQAKYSPMVEDKYASDSLGFSSRKKMQEHRSKSARDDEDQKPFSIKKLQMGKQILEDGEQNIQAGEEAISLKTPDLIEMPSRRQLQPSRGGGRGGGSGGPPSDGSQDGGDSSGKPSDGGGEDPGSETRPGDDGDGGDGEEPDPEAGYFLESMNLDWSESLDNLCSNTEDCTGRTSSKRFLQAGETRPERPADGSDGGSDEKSSSGVVMPDLKFSWPTKAPPSPLASSQSQRLRILQGKCGYIKAELQDNFHYFEHPKESQGFHTCVPADECGTVFSFKSYKIQVKCSGFEVFMAKMGGFVVVLLLIIIVAICIGIKYIRWKQKQEHHAERSRLRHLEKQKKEAEVAEQKMRQAANQQGAIEMGHPPTGRPAAGGGTVLFDIDETGAPKAKIDVGQMHGEPVIGIPQPSGSEGEDDEDESDEEDDDETPREEVIPVKAK